MTLTIVLLNYNDVDTAIIRVFNIIIGIVGAMLMMRFFYPQYARDKIIEALWDFIEHFACILEDYLDPSISFVAFKENYMKHDHSILEGFMLFNRLVSEAKIETKKTPLFISNNLVALGHMRHLFRLISVFVYDVTTEDIRADAWICCTLRQVLSDLRAIQRRLANEEIEVTTHLMLENPIGMGVSIDPNMKLIELMLTNITQETALLAEDIKRVLCIHAIYTPRLRPDYAN